MPEELNLLRPQVLHFMVKPSLTPGLFVAHCLDYDLVASADDAEEALRRLDFLVRVHVEVAAQKKLVVALQHRAPDDIWDEFREGQKELQMRTLQIGGLDQLDEQSRFEVGVIAALVKSADQLCASVN